MPIEILDEQDKKELEALTGKDIPARPGDHGYSSDQIRRMLYEPSLWLFGKLQSLSSLLKKYIEGEVDGENAYIGILERLSDIENTIALFDPTTWVCEKAKRDELGNIIHQTYATIQQMQDGDQAVLKYVKTDGTTEAISAIDGRIQSLLQVYNSFIQSNFTNGKANTASVSDRAHQDKDGNPIDTTYLKVANIVNDLIHTDTNKALSAYQGKVLYDLLVTIQQTLQSSDEDLDSMQELVNFIHAHRDEYDQLFNISIKYTDIIDNYNTEVANKPVSAKVAFLLKGLIDNIVSGTTKVSKAETADKIGNTTEEEIVKSVNGITPTNGNVGITGFVSFNVVEDGDYQKLVVNYQGDIGGTFSLRDIGDYKYVVFTPTGA